ncbi:MAG: cell division protein ZapB [Nitrospirae bacterium]|nr:cell division protein ZapB [Nitrospirota bacterium]MCL5021907.1 cell division protein ZapB [Nitrospirota bacterium]
MPKLIRDIREFFWPLLEGEAKHYQIAPEKIQEALKDEKEKGKVDELLSLSKSIHDREEERRSTIEAKATTLLGATGLATTLIVSFGKSLLFEFEKLGALTATAFAVFFLVTLLYFWRTIAYSLRALSRSGFLTMLPHEIIELKGIDECEYKKRMAAVILDKTAKNYPPTNVKVDWMVMSQEYFKRGIYTIIIGTIVLSLLVVLHWIWLHRADHPFAFSDKQKMEKADPKKGDFDTLRDQVEKLKKEQAELKEENESLKDDIDEIQQQMGNLQKKPIERGNIKKKPVKKE